MRKVSPEFHGDNRFPYLIMKDSEYEGDYLVFLVQEEAIRGVFTRLYKTKVREVRDWLSEWLGDEHPATYAAEDVERLVDFAQACFGNSIIKRELGYSVWKDQSVLAPFLPPPDPDAELVKKIRGIRDDVGRDVDAGNQAIIDAVRAHDANKS